MKKYLYILLFFTNIAGCSFYKDYIPQNSDSYQIKNNKIVFESDTIKMLVSCQYIRPNEKEQITILDIYILCRKDSLAADLNKIEMHADREVKKTYLRDLIGNGGSDERKWSLEKDKEYSFSLEFVTEDPSLKESDAYLKQISLDLSGLFKINGGSVSSPKLYFISE